MASETHGFQAEVSRLLDIVAHSIYSDKAVFLRELISNASDACDRLRYLALTEPALTEGDGEFRIRLIPDKKAGTLTIADNGIGMNRAELIDNLGTIARSGTAAFVKSLEAGREGGKQGSGEVTQIGQFGVGFYAAFMVAERVEVLSRRAGDSQGWRWESDGRGAFTVAEAEVEKRGTSIVLHLRKGEDGFLEPDRLRQVVAAHSDHVGLPIVLVEGGKETTINAASALWTRPRSEVTKQQYGEFFRHVSHGFDEPWLTVHFRAEGKIEYTALVFVPASKPFDLFHPDRKHALKLYVKRVFITDDCEDVLPAWLRFLRGVIDSEDLPLSLSREMLQHNPLLAKIRAGLVKRVLGELEKKAEKEPEDYAAFWDNFGAVLKEGLYEDHEHRDKLLGLARFRSTAGDGLVSLEQYAGRMKPGQEAIFTISGESLEALKRSPQLEGFAARGVEVLLLTDPVDEFWMPAVGSFKEKPFKSVTRAGADLEKIARPEGEAARPEPQPAGVDSLIALFRLTLKDAVKDVRGSQRLTDSAVCLVAAEGDMDIHLERLLRQHRQLEAQAKRVLEVNPHHPLIAGLAERLSEKGSGEEIAEAAWLLLDQARIVDGETLADPASFARRLASMLSRSIAA